jgi:hypothetical protein
MAITGLYAFGGLGMAIYASLALPPNLKIWGIPPLAFGALNFPLFFAWSRQASEELAEWAKAADDRKPAASRAFLS